MKFKIIYLYYVGIISTLLSQLPIFVENEITQQLQIFWFLPVSGLVYRAQMRLNNTLLSLFLALLLLSIFLFFVSNIISFSYLLSPHYTNIIKSLFILLISYNYAFFVDLKDFSKSLGWISFFAGIILSFGLYKHVFIGGFDLTSRVYAYTAKNSISQILISCLVLVFFLMPSSLNCCGFSTKGVKFLYAILLILVLFLLKSRATILGLIIFLFIIFKRRDVKPKILLTLVFFLILTVFIFNPQVRNVFFYSIILAGRDVNDMNDATSGRLDFFIDYPKLFMSHPLVGHGFVFSESFPLSVLLDYGLLGGVFVFYIALIPICLATKLWALVDDDFIASFISIVFIYSLNSIFEQQAPFGPGAKNVLLWVVLGFVLKNGKSAFRDVGIVKSGFISGREV